MNNTPYKKIRLCWAKFMSSIPSYSEPTSQQQDGTVRYLGWVWMKGVYFEILVSLFISASDPIFLPPVSGRNINKLPRPLYFILRMATLNCSHATRKLRGDADCRDMFTYLFSWMDLIDCNRMIPLHNNWTFMQLQARLIIVIKLAYFLISLEFIKENTLLYLSFVFCHVQFPGVVCLWTHW